MIGRDILQLSLAASVGVALFSVSAAAQQRTLKQQLVGTWTFVRTEARQPDKPMILPFGENPKGVNIFTEDGHFVQIQIADGIPKYASNSRVTGTSEETKRLCKEASRFSEPTRWMKPRRCLSTKLNRAHSRIGSA